VFYNARLYKQQAFQCKPFKSIILYIVIFNDLNFSGMGSSGGGKETMDRPSPHVFERNQSPRNERDIPNFSNKIILVSRIL
jgi:hypothetical protein